jgi:hypothetical protein
VTAGLSPASAASGAPYAASAKMLSKQADCRIVFDMAGNRIAINFDTLTYSCCQSIPPGLSGRQNHVYTVFVISRNQQRLFGPVQ